MLSPIFSLLLIPFLAAMFLAINMGGSGTSPSFSTAYGANLVRKDLIPGLFGIFVFLGAIVAGKKVALTIGKGILPGEQMDFVLTSIIIFAVSISLFIANLLKVPQSTSQATVFALVGPAIYFNVLQTDKLFFEIIPTWFILPVISFLFALFFGKIILYQKKRKITKFETIETHPSLRSIVIASSCYVAFAIGANNVANAAGPIASMVLQELDISSTNDNFLLVIILSTLIIAPCFGIGSSILGYRVVQTTGKEIAELGPIGATLISIITATLLLFASTTKGLPTSLVQLNTGAIIGLGIAKIGWKKIFKLSSVKKLFSIWIIAPLIAFALSLFLTLLADKIGLL